MSKKDPVVLLVEDSSADQEIFKRVIEDRKLSWKFIILNSGMEALSLLNQKIAFSGESQKNCFPT